MARASGHRAHGVENEDGQLGPYLFVRERHAGDRRADQRTTDVPGTRLVQRVRDDVIPALRTVAKTCAPLCQPIEDLTHDFFQSVMHQFANERMDPAQPADETAVATSLTIGAGGSVT